MPHSSTISVQTMIGERWSELREGSPDRNVDNPVIHLYRTAKQNIKGLQGLMDAMLIPADTPPRLTEL